MRFRTLFKPSAALRVEKERAWLLEHRGHEHADAFEAELSHIRELLEDHPELGARSPWSANERRLFLDGCRFHLFYRVYHEDRVIVVVRLRHEKQRPPR